MRRQARLRTAWFRLNLLASTDLCHQFWRPQRQLVFLGVVQFCGGGVKRSVSACLLHLVIVPMLWHISTTHIQSDTSAAASPRVRPESRAG